MEPTHLILSEADAHAWAFDLPNRHASGCKQTRRAAGMDAGRFPTAPWMARRKIPASMKRPVRTGLVRTFFGYFLDSRLRRSPLRGRLRRSRFRACASKESDPPQGEALLNSEAGQAFDLAGPLFCI